MGTAAGKPREPDSPPTWYDPVEHISKESSQIPVSKTSLKPKKVSFGSRQESYPRHRSEYEYRELRRRDNDVKHFSLANDKTAVPVANRWREQRTIGSNGSREQELLKNGSEIEDIEKVSYSRSNVLRRRFEDIPVSAMWREPTNYSLTGHSDTPKTNMAENLPRRATREEMFREKEEREESWLHERLAEREAEKKSALQVENVSSVPQNQKCSGPTMPQDTKPVWDFSTQISYRRPVPNRSVSPLSFLPRTLSDPLRKQITNQPQYIIGRNKTSSDVPGPSHLIPRTISDPVEAKPVWSRRPATPFVSGTLTSNRPLHDYILDRRKNGLGLRNTSFSSLQNKLRTISDNDEQPKRKSPGPGERHSCVSRYLKP